MFSEITFLETEEDQKISQLIYQVVTACFQKENLENTNLYLSIILTNQKHIKETNKKYRGIDQETDVLSFPMFEKEEIVEMIQQNPSKEKVKNNDLEERPCEVLGDIMISIPRVKEQAQEYGHSFNRELAYMVVHGFYHIMGYDHMQEDEKKIMREKEEAVLNDLKLTRE